MARKVSAAKAAEKIQELCAQGMTHAEIREKHPELNDGWGHGITKATATRPSRGGGAMGGPGRPVAARP